MQSGRPVGSEQRGWFSSPPTRCRASCLCGLNPLPLRPPTSADSCLACCPVPQVEYSKQLNDTRIKVLQAREDAVQVRWAAMWCV